MKIVSALKCLRAVVGREVHQHRPWWWIALVTGLLPPLSLLGAGLHSQDPAVVRDALTVLVTVLLTGSSTAVLAASALSSDYAGGRIAFFLARPISPFCLWLGKLLAGFVTVATTAAFSLLPSLLIGGRPWEGFAAFLPKAPQLRTWAMADVPSGLWPLRWNFNAMLNTSPEASQLFAFCLVMGTIGAICHLLAIMLRLQNRWTLADAVVIAVLGSAAVATGSYLAEVQARTAQQSLVVSVLLGLISAALVGGWAQLRWGGADPIRAHGVQSKVLWVILALSIVPAMMESRALEGLGPDDMDEILDIYPAPKGDWSVVAGLHRSSGYRPSFAWSSRTSEWILLDAGPKQTNAPLFSPDGSALLWPACREVNTPCDLLWIDLEAPDKEKAVHRLGITADRYASFFAHNTLSPDGRLYATAKNSRIRIHRMPQGSPVRSFELPDGLRVSHLYSVAEEDHVLYVIATPTDTYSRDDPPPEQRLYRLSWSRADSDELTEIARLTGFWRPARHGSWFIGSWPESGIDLLDAATGRRIHHRVPEGRHMRRSLFLDDGRIAWITSGLNPNSPWANQVILSELDGSEHTLDLSDLDLSLMGGEISPGKIIFGRFDETNRRHIAGRSQFEALVGSNRHWRTIVVDLNSGDILTTIEGFLPFWCHHSLHCAGSPGTPGSDWLVDAWGRPHRLTLDSFNSPAVTPLMNEPSLGGES